MATTASTESPHSGTAAAESPMHETSGVELRPLIKFTVWFVVGLVVVHLLIWWIFIGFRSAVAQERQVTGVSAARIPPLEPRLEPSIDHNRLPADDLRRMRDADEAELKRRGLLDENGNPQFSDELVQRIAAQAEATK